MKNVLLALACLLASACASSVSYTDPVSGDRARVLFAIDGGMTGGAVVRNYQDAECNGEREWMRLTNGRVPGAEVRRIGMPSPGNFMPNAMQELYVPAGQPIYLMFDGATTGTNIVTTTIRSCGVPIAFTPEPGHDYELLMYRTNPERCVVELNRLVGEGKEGRVPIQVFENVASEGCLDAFSRFRLF